MCVKKVSNRTLARNFAKSLRYKMAASDVSVEDLAKSLGANPSVVRAYTQGRYTPTLQTLVAVAKVLGCTVTELVGY